MTKTDCARLLRAAKTAGRSSYSPHSRLPVGAAVLTAGGRIHSGTNVENSSYGLTVCAERVAVFSAVTAGCRSIRAIAVFADTHALTPPCGACLQVAAEFGENPEILLANRTRHELMRLSDLMPRAFRLRK